MKRISRTRNVAWVAIVVAALWLLLLLPWLLADRFAIFVVLFSLAELAAAGLVYLGLFLLASAVTKRLLRGESRAFYEEHPARLNAFVHLCVGLFAVGGTVVNYFWLPGKFQPLSLATDLVVAALAVCLGWSLATRRPARALFMIPVAAAIAVLAAAGRPAVEGASSPPGAPATSAIAALPYVAWVPAVEDIDKAGVTYHDRDKTSPGFNLYCPQGTASAQLVDMDGGVVHEWAADVSGGDIWSHIEMCRNGDLLVAVSRSGRLMRLDWDSNIMWIDDRRFYHHDIEVADNGDIYVLARKADVLRVYGLPVPVLDDYVVVLSPEREIKREISLYAVLRDRFPAAKTILSRYTYLMQLPYLRTLYRHRFSLSSSPVDFFHANTVELIDRDVDEVFRKGNILFCSRTLSLIGVIDPVAQELLWTWGPGELDWPHQPTLLDNGHVLVFDNGYHRKYSRILEIDPRAGTVEWEYEAQPREKFFSQFRGASQRLPNGNTLVTNGENGIAFEVTRDGEMVWEFYNPLIRPESGRRSSIYRLIRLADVETYPRLQDLR
ncbi:MAG: arylsulfotransferase family protein [Candidatus Krumholzibacteriia bacterium]